MLIPLKVDVPTDRRPWANWAILAVTIAVSVLCFSDAELLCQLGGIAGRGAGSQISTEHFPLPVLAVTSTLVHAGWMHLAGNMLFLWVMGNAVNYKLGQLGYLGVYLAAALVGGMAHYTFLGSPVIGASGAINGVIGAFLVFFPRNDMLVFWWLWIRPSLKRISSGWIILLWIGWDVLMLSSGLHGKTALWAHVGGFAVGFVIALSLAATGWIKPSPDEQTLLEVLGAGRRA